MLLWTFWRLVFPIRWVTLARTFTICSFRLCLTPAHLRVVSLTVWVIPTQLTWEHLFSSFGDTNSLEMIATKLPAMRVTYTSFIKPRSLGCTDAGFTGFTSRI